MRAASVLAAALGAALLAAGGASARGGHVVFDGGTSEERAQVAAALRASAFDWNVLPTVTVHIAARADSRALPGEVWLDADLLDAGTFGWGVVQHEFAHEFDYVFLDAAGRAALLQTLGGTEWFGDEQHAELGAERFASTFAWAFWQSNTNVMKPESRTDESAALPPARFRALVAQLLAAA